MRQFKLILQNEKRRSYDRIAILFFILSGIGMAVASLYFKNIIHKEKFYWTLIPILFHLAPLALLFWKKSVISLKDLAISVFLVVVFWVLFGYWWAGLAIILFVLLYWTSQQELRIIVGETGVRYDFFPSNSLQWNDLNNLILKDGLLTIDRKNNKITQNMIDESKTLIIEKEFNEFCNQQLKVKEVI